MINADLWIWTAAGMRKAGAHVEKPDYVEEYVKAVDGEQMLEVASTAEVEQILDAAYAVDDPKP